MYTNDRTNNSIKDVVIRKQSQTHWSLSSKGINPPIEIKHQPTLHQRRSSIRCNIQRKCNFREKIVLKYQKKKETLKAPIPHFHLDRTYHRYSRHVYNDTLTNLFPNTAKAALQFESQHESALSKIQALEDTSRYQRREEEEIVVKEKPSFTVQLNGPTSLVEGQSAHYECRIEPYPDPTMKVEWFHNGKPLSTGHRYRTTCDFGFAALDVLTVYAEDSGTYTCQATNRLGSAKSSINLDVKCK